MTTEPKIAQTWEECARHVEVGGVVQWLHHDDVWLDEPLLADIYRRLNHAPGKRGRRPRRLMPIEDANPEGMSPGPEVDGRPTWYGTAKDARVAGMTVVRVRTNGKWSFVGLWPAASIVQARYPLPPKPKTERVHWSVADGREDPHDGEIIRVEKIPGLMPRVNFAGGGHMHVTSPDGTVEVLAKDGES